MAPVSPTIDADGSTDPVTRFFDSLSPPQEQFSRWVGNTGQGTTEAAACMRLIAESASRVSNDPDFEFILQSVKKMVSTYRSVSDLYEQLAAVAVDKPPTADDQSNKADQFRYCLWMAQGRKDETSPFAGIPPSDKQSAPSISHAFLPDDPLAKSCAECGNQDGTTNCSGCLVQHGGRVTFATAYCSKECQAKHWNKHKAFCRQLQQIHRARSVYQEIFEHYLDIAAPRNLTEIVERNGIIMVKHDGNIQPETAYYWAPFPDELASSREVRRAVLLQASNNEVFDHAGSLLEMLIRPVSAKIERVECIARNIERPCCVISTHKEPNRYRFLSFWYHSVALVTLPCGVSVVLDPTAAQFGWHEELAPHLAYNQQRVHKVAATHNVDRHRPGAGLTVEHLDRVQRGKSKPVAGRELVMDAVVLGLLPRIQAKFGGVKKFLQLKENEFPSARAAVVDAAKRGLSMVVDEYRKGQRPINVGNPFHFGPVINNQQYWEEVDMVWCSDAEAKMIHTTHPGKMQGIQKRWKARWNQIVEIKLASPTTKTGQATTAGLDAGRE